MVLTRSLRLAVIALMPAWLLMAPFAHAKGELLLFPDLAVDFRDVPAELEPVMDERGLDPHLAIFGTLEGSRFRFLFEGSVDDKEVELERLQLGLRLGPASTLWLGKFHNPFDYWTSRIHHGRFLQTSRSRPGLVQFEDDGGIMPIHVTGVLLEGLYTTPDDRGWRYNLILGVGPGVAATNTGSRLESPSLLAPFENDGRHKRIATLRLAYLPDVFADDELGVFFSSARIPSQDLAFIEGDIEQLSAGLFGHWSHEQLRLFGAATYFRHRTMMTMAGGVPQSMRHGMSNYYIQEEYGWRPSWTAYARQEYTRGVGDDPYVQSFAMLVTKRVLLGVRYELTANQALTVELDRARHQHGGEAFNALSVQWSAIFP
jgi:hypothetical protein